MNEKVLREALDNKGFSGSDIEDILVCVRAALSTAAGHCGCTAEPTSGAEPQSRKGMERHLRMDRDLCRLSIISTWPVKDGLIEQEYPDRVIDRIMAIVDEYARQGEGLDALLRKWIAAFREAVAIGNERERDDVYLANLCAESEAALNPPAEPQPSGMEESRPNGWNIKQILVYIWQQMSQDMSEQEYPYSRFANSDMGRRLRVEMAALAHTRPSNRFTRIK